MGYDFKRIILPPGNNANKAKKFAQQLRKVTNRVSKIIYTDFSEKKYRRQFLKTAQQTSLNYLELDTPINSKILISCLEKVFEEDGFLYREQNDEGIDIIHPRLSWLEEIYGSQELDWCIKVIEDNFSANEICFYSIPSNPESLTVESPIFAALLVPAKPGETHPCPMCGKNILSKFPRRQCRDQDCAFGYIPFTSIQEALKVQQISLDYGAWGKCPRKCGRSMQFTHKIEQCYKCGQLIEAIDDKFKHELLDNRKEIEMFLNELKNQRKSSEANNSNWPNQANESIESHEPRKQWWEFWK